MVRTDMGASGVMFTIDTETGFEDVIIINGAYGLGEMVVQGHVIPDEYLIAKHRLRVYEVGISYNGRTYEEGKKIGWSDGLAALWHIVRYNALTRS